MVFRRQQLWIASLVAFVIAGQIQIHSQHEREIGALLEKDDAVSVSAAHQTSSTNVKVNFVFLMALEGTGHHLYESLVMNSPGDALLRELGIVPEYTTQLQRLLYSHKKNRYSALWSAPCHWPDEKKPLVEPNITDIQLNLVELMISIAKKVLSNPNTNSTSLSIPVNGRGGGDDYGLVSYPGFLKPCRPLQNPNLDVWYQVCERAQRLNSHVGCQHIYLYRDPHEVIKSTTIKRKFNQNPLEAMQLYSNLLSVILYQLQKHSNRLAACWEYRQPDNEDVARLWWGYDNLHKVTNGNSTNYQNFQATLRKLYHSRPFEKDEAITKDMQGYTDSLIEVHDTVVETCRRLLQSQKTGQSNIIPLQE